MSPHGDTREGDTDALKSTYEVMVDAHAPWLPEGRLLRVEFGVTRAGKTAAGLKALFGSRTPAWDCELRYPAPEGIVVRASRNPYQADSIQEALFFFVRSAREGRLGLADPVFGDPEHGVDSGPVGPGAQIAARGMRIYRDSHRRHQS